MRDLTSGPHHKYTTDMISINKTLLYKYIYTRGEYSKKNIRYIN